MKILLIAGGWSTERQISLNGAKNIESALKQLGHEVTLFDLLPEYDSLLETASKHDFAFLNLHGCPGEDGLVQAMLDCIHCPYQGSGPQGSFLAINKAASKQIFRAKGLPTADWEFLPSAPPESWIPKAEFPVFVKSNTGGSSLHLGRATNIEQARAALNVIFVAGEEAIIEPEIPGREMTCAILGDQPLPPILIEPLAGGFFNHQSKYAEGGAKELCPAPVEPGLNSKIQELALAAHQALGLRVYSRADFIVTDDDQCMLLEVNTLPGMTSTSLLPKAAAAIGLDFPMLLQKIIDLSLEK